jgi:hypothetical protein
MEKWTFSTKWPTQALWKAHQAEKARARHHKRKREGKPAAALEVTSLSGELKQAKAAIAEQLSDYRASSAYLSAAATKTEGEVCDLKQQVRNVIHPRSPMAKLTSSASPQLFGARATIKLFESSARKIAATARNEVDANYKKREATWKKKLEGADETIQCVKQQRKKERPAS